jgi:hypothetical protein
MSAAGVIGASELAIALSACAKGWHEEEAETEEGARIELILVFEILLLVAVVAGVLIGWQDAGPTR